VDSRDDGSSLCAIAGTAGQVFYCLDSDGHARLCARLWLTPPFIERTCDSSVFATSSADMRSSMAIGYSAQPRSGGLLGQRANVKKARSRTQHVYYPALVFLLVLFSWLLSGRTSSPSTPEPAIHARAFKADPSEDGVNTTLAKRAGDPDTPTFAQRVDTGRRLWCMMESTTTAQSTWTLADLQRWGWDELDITTAMGTFQGPVAPGYATAGLNAANDAGWGYLQIENFLDSNGNEQEVDLLFS
jgi:hypothetical protein